jgi:hypothetical protein
MLFNSVALLAAASLSQAVILPERQVSNGSKCIDPPQRIEWRKLEPAQQKSYIDAVLCLKTKPSRIGLKSLFDDFPHVHFRLAGSSKPAICLDRYAAKMNSSSPQPSNVPALAQVLHQVLLRCAWRVRIQWPWNASLPPDSRKWTPLT